MRFISIYKHVVMCLYIDKMADSYRKVKKMKRIISIVLTFCMLISMNGIAFAAEETVQRVEVNSATDTVVYDETITFSGPYQGKTIELPGPGQYQIVYGVRGADKSYDYSFNIEDQLDSKGKADGKAHSVRKNFSNSSVSVGVTGGNGQIYAVSIQIYKE